MQFMGKQGTKSRDLGAMSSLIAEKFKVAICAFMEKRAKRIVLVMNLLALTAIYTIQCLLCVNGQGSSSPFSFTVSIMLSYCQ